MTDSFLDKKLKKSQIGLTKIPKLYVWVLELRDVLEVEC